MAASYQDFTGTTSKIKDFTFPYIKQSDIKVRKTTAAGVVTELVEGTLTSQSPGQYTWTNATRITINDAPVSGDTIRVYRDTASDALVGTFYPGSAIRSSDLNDNFTQNLYVTQEAEDSVDSAVTDAAAAVVTADTAKATADTAKASADDAADDVKRWIKDGDGSDTEGDEDDADFTARPLKPQGVPYAVSRSTTAINDSATALSKATEAETTANKARDDIAVALNYVIVADKTALIALTLNNSDDSETGNIGDFYEVTDATNINNNTGGDITWTKADGSAQTTNPDTMTGVTWDDKITVKVRWRGDTEKWEYVSYRNVDPESNYIRSASPELTGTVTLKNNADLKLTETTANGSAYVGLKGPTDMGSASSYTVTLPTATPTANQILKADASTPTTLTWATDSATDATKLPLAGGTMSGNIVMAGSQTVDGRDLSADGSKLDAIEAAADVTDATNVAAAGAGMLTVDQSWSGAQRGTIVDFDGASGRPAVAATTTIDFSVGNNFYIDLADANVTTVNASNATAGQSGSIIVRGHGSNKLAGWNAVYKWGTPAAPTITADTAKFDRIDYFIHDASNINMVWSGNY